MEELQRWLDVAPTVRRCQAAFDFPERGIHGYWMVSVWLEGTEQTTGTGEGGSLTFAAVAAILDLNKRRTES